MDTTSKHGTRSRYSRGCRCDLCRRAQAVGNREANARQRAIYLSRGLTSVGRPRKTPYDSEALDLMERFGLEPDPRWVWTPPEEG